jgi:gamma-glutamyltranspeptidase / glutathione hydrolase
MWRRWGVLAMAGVALSACNTSGKLQLASGSPPRMTAFVAADEPQAAAIGRDILADGGTAMDAAAAVGLAMGAALPSRAGLAGGGVCVVFNPNTKDIRTLDFLPRGSGNTAVPLFVRAFYALQAAGGKLRWAQIAAPAERLAGRSTVSRALAADLAASAGRLDPAAKAVFAPGGKPLTEGASLEQPQLSALLSQVRQTGFLPFQSADGAEAMARGFGLPAATIRDGKPEWRAVVPVELGSDAVSFADVPESNIGAVMSAAATAATEADSGHERTAALAAIKAAAKGGNEAPAAGFAVVDSDQGAVACSLTMGGAFGSGRSVAGTGMLAALPVKSAGFGAPAVQANVKMMRAGFAGAGSANGNDGPLAAAYALLDVALPIVLEGKAGAEVLRTRAADAPGRVSLVSCLRDRWGTVGGCEPAADPRNAGAGFVTTVPH